MSICKHATSTAEFPFPYFSVGDLMLQNIFSNVMTVTIQVTSTLQAMKQLIIYFSFSVVFTGRACVSSFWTLFRMAGGGSAKRFPASFHQHSWLTVLIILPQSYKILGPYLVPVSNYWAWTKTIPLKNRFFWSNPYNIWVMITSLIKVLN